MKPLRIALAQCRQTACLETNARTILAFLDRAADTGASIVCFPETQTVGYRVDIAPAGTPVEPERLDEVHRRVAERCGALGVAFVLGTETPLASDPRHGKPYNSALVIGPDGAILGVHHKTRLTPLDATVYSPGRTFETFDLCGVRVGVVISFEGFRFAQTTQECVRQGAQLVFHPQNNTTRPNDWKIPVHHALIVDARLMAYALGRSLTLSDVGAADALVPALRARTDRLPALIELIAASEPFQSK